MNEEELFRFVVENLTLKVNGRDFPDSERIDIELVLKHPSTGEEYPLGGSFFCIPKTKFSRYE